jgi:hypothetical protein
MIVSYYSCLTSLTPCHLISSQHLSLRVLSRFVVAPLPPVCPRPLLVASGVHDAFFCIPALLGGRESGNVYGTEGPGEGESVEADIGSGPCAC